MGCVFNLNYSSVISCPSLGVIKNSFARRISMSEVATINFNIHSINIPLDPDFFPLLAPHRSSIRPDLISSLTFYFVSLSLSLSSSSSLLSFRKSVRFDRAPSETYGSIDGCRLALDNILSRSQWTHKIATIFRLKSS